MHRFTILHTFPAILLLTAPAMAQVGPDYERPALDATDRFKGVTWREANPSSHLPKGEWWTIFRDPALNGLVERASTNNQEIKAALARFDQARATARMTRANLLPTIGVPLSGEQQRTSANMPSAFPLDGLRYDGPAYNALLDFGWEIDLWGKIRRGAEAEEANALAVADAVHNVLLGIQAEVASHYFQIRTLDGEIHLVREAVALRGEALKIARARVIAGAGSELEEAQSETEVATAEAEISQLRTQRDQLENAIAILVGANPSSFTVPVNAKSLPSPPRQPSALPTDLLERRPDLAAAERQLAAATARIGVAEAQYFPSVSLMGNGGFQSGDIDLLFDPASLMWSYGPKIRVPIFSGNKNRFNLSRSQAAHDEALARYRQTFLSAIAEVETSLSMLRHLQSESASLQRARTSAERAADLARTRYESGTSPYLDVLSADRTALTTRLASVRVSGKRLIATVSLIKAIGGGWEKAKTTDLPLTTPDPAARLNSEEGERGGFRKLFKRRE